MKLNYQNSTQNVQVLRNSEQRIEFHIGHTNDACWALVALSGPASGFPQRCKVQGPFHSRDQAIASAGAIANALSEQGFESCQDAPNWRVQAQKLFKEQRLSRLENKPNSEFIPLGILPSDTDQ